MRQRDVEVVPLSEGILAEVVQIEQEAFSSPWPDRVFSEELQREWAYVDVAQIRDGSGNIQVVAYCNYWLVRDEIHLLNIATHTEYKRRGYGRVLMDHMLRFARRHGCRVVTLEVRRSNVAAISLYGRYGFEEVGVRAKYYKDKEDAVVMLLELEG